MKQRTDGRVVDGGGLENVDDRWRTEARAPRQRLLEELAAETTASQFRFHFGRLSSKRPRSSLFASGTYTNPTKNATDRL